MQIFQQILSQGPSEIGCKKNDKLLESSEHLGKCLNEITIAGLCFELRKVRDAVHCNFL